MSFLNNPTQRATQHRLEIITEMLVNLIFPPDLCPDFQHVAHVQERDQEDDSADNPTTGYPGSFSVLSKDERGKEDGDDAEVDVITAGVAVLGPFPLGHIVAKVIYHLYFSSNVSFRCNVADVLLRF